MREAAPAARRPEEIGRTKEIEKTKEREKMGEVILTVGEVKRTKEPVPAAKDPKKEKNRRASASTSFVIILVKLLASFGFCCYLF